MMEIIRLYRVAGALLRFKTLSKFQFSNFNLAMRYEHSLTSICHNLCIQFNALHFNAIQFNVMHFNSLQFNSIRFNYAIKFDSLQFNLMHTNIMEVIQLKRNNWCTTGCIIEHSNFISNATYLGSHI